MVVKDTPSVPSALGEATRCPALSHPKFRAIAQKNLACRTRTALCRRVVLFEDILSHSIAVEKSSDPCRS